MTAVSQPLDGLLMVDLSEWVAGPYCTKLLADFGARVIKVEAPGGDPARRMGPFPTDTPVGDAGGLFAHLNTNKQSISVDLTEPEGAAVVRALAAQADVVVESFAPGALAGFGLAPAALMAANPDLVVTSVTGFGQNGPYAQWQVSEIVAFAMGGPMKRSGNPAREPVKLVGNVVEMQSGATACTATLGALYGAQETGRGQHVDVATFETQNGSLDRRRYSLLSYEYSSTIGERASAVGAGRPSAGGRLPASDGEVTTGRIWPTHVERMVAVVDDHRLTEAWREHGPQLMAVAPEVVNEAIGAWVAQRTVRQATGEAQAAGWPVVVVNDPRSLITYDHLVQRNFWHWAEHPGLGELPYTGPPWRVDGGGWALRRTAPALGEDTDAVLGGLLGFDDDRINDLRAVGAVA